LRSSRADCLPTVILPSSAPGTTGAYRCVRGHRKKRTKVREITADTDASFCLACVLSVVSHRLSASLARLGERPPFHLFIRGVVFLRRLSVARKLKGALVVSGSGLLVVALVYAWTGHNSERAAATFAAHQEDAALAAALATEVADARRLQTRYATTFDDADRHAIPASDFTEAELWPGRGGSLYRGSAEETTAARWLDLLFSEDDVRRIGVPPTSAIPQEQDVPNSLAPQPNARWSEAEMTLAIVGWAKHNSSRNREAAWRDHFVSLKSEHGWDNRSFRAHWSIALESTGQSGRPKSAQ
jgi:hypothetical protein